MQEAQHGIKYVASRKEPAEYLGVVAVQELAPELDSVFTRQNGEVVPDLIALEHLIYLRFKKERGAKAECGGESHGCIRWHIGRHGRTWPVFACKAEVAFVHLSG